MAAAYVAEFVQICVSSANIVLPRSKIVAFLRPACLNLIFEIFAAFLETYLRCTLNFLDAAALHEFLETPHMAYRTLCVWVFIKFVCLIPCAAAQIVITSH